jgi:glycosyltransferase involved in cell wall biosynthesis
MKICLIFSSKCSTYLPENGFNIDGLYDTQALTGSESGIFNVARGLSELGHSVDVFCRVMKPYLAVERLAGANVYPQNTPMSAGYDAYIAWNDADHLPSERTRGVKICSQQLNDFSISESVYDRRTDLYAFPSKVHLDFMVERSRLKPEKCIVVPNSTNLEFFQPDAEKEDGSVVYISSPDRGLHHLLDIFPLVRARVKNAKLKIYYRFWPWYEVTKFGDDLVGQRARSIRNNLLKLGQNGENGVTLVGPINNKKLANVLSSTMVLAYPCLPVQFTEGFSIAILDACAAGCVPVISDVDALPSIYENVACIVTGNPGKKLNEWADKISYLLTNERARTDAAKKAVSFAGQYSRQEVSKMWERVIMEWKR